MASDLTLTRVSATLAGVVRRGTPAVHRYLGHGLVCDTVDPGQTWARFLPDASDSEPTTPDLSVLAVDLPDATGRAHVAWAVLAVAHHSGWPDLHTGARLWLDPGVYAPGLEYARLTLWRTLRNAGRIHDWLADLDPSDPRLLPDGSRWVDAEALARVAVHVLGGEATRG